MLVGVGDREIASAVIVFNTAFFRVPSEKTPRTFYHVPADHRSSRRRFVAAVVAVKADTTC